ncbi:MAG: glycosyltransferase [Verrucomicrobia bacterium]|nr:glycosyltransferase [Verrucomicrobiota bacterium]
MTTILQRLGLVRPRATEPTPGNRVIQGLWIGDRLRLNEQLSIKSFLAHGHEYHLYAYDPVEGVPDGVLIKDATEIMPRESIFQFHTGSYAMFADHFRIHLLLKRGGWWCDLDMICLRPFDLEDEVVVISEPEDGYKSAALTNGIMKFPVDAPFGQACLEFLNRVDNETNTEWILTNRGMLQHVIAERGCASVVKPPIYFSPLFWGEATPVFTDPKLAGKGRKLMTNRQTYTLHLFNEFWRKNGLDQNARFDTDSLIEQLRRRHGV